MFSYLNEGFSARENPLWKILQQSVLEGLDEA